MIFAPPWLSNRFKKHCLFVKNFLCESNIGFVVVLENWKVFGYYCYWHSLWTELNINIDSIFEMYCIIHWFDRILFDSLGVMNSRLIPIHFIVMPAMTLLSALSNDREWCYVASCQRYIDWSLTHWHWHRFENIAIELVFCLSISFNWIL